MESKDGILQGSYHTRLFLIACFDHILANVCVDFVDNGDQQIQHDDDVEYGTDYEQEEINLTVFIDIHVLEFSKSNQERKLQLLYVVSYILVVQRFYCQAGWFFGTSEQMSGVVSRLFAVRAFVFDVF